MFESNVQFTGGAKVERRGFCKVCRRALKNPKYVELGIGPICAKKQGVGFHGLDKPASYEGLPRHIQRIPTLTGRRAHYDVVKVTPEIVWIRDRNEDGVISVTNDAENVVKELHNKHPGARVIYQDTMGEWDELKHDGQGTFTGFAPARDMRPEGVAWA